MQVTSTYIFIYCAKFTRKPRADGDGLTNSWGTSEAERGTKNIGNFASKNTCTYAKAAVICHLRYFASPWTRTLGMKLSTTPRWHWHCPDQPFLAGVLSPAVPSTGSRAGPHSNWPGMRQGHGRQPVTVFCPATVGGELGPTACYRTRERLRNDLQNHPCDHCDHARHTVTHCPSSSHLEY